MPLITLALYKRPPTDCLRRHMVPAPYSLGLLLPMGSCCIYNWILAIKDEVVLLINLRIPAPLSECCLCIFIDIDCSRLCIAVTTVMSLVPRRGPRLVGETRDIECGDWKSQEA